MKYIVIAAAMVLCGFASPSSGTMQGSGDGKGRPAKTTMLRTCANEVGATATAYRLADLPATIRQDLIGRVRSLGGRLADSGAPLMQTDAPREKEKDYAYERFAQGMFINDTWFVQVEQAMVAGVQTTNYQRQTDGTFAFTPRVLFRGPACASIKAALSGVSTLQGY